MDAHRVFTVFKDGSQGQDPDPFVNLRSYYFSLPTTRTDWSKTAEMRPDVQT
jgi:hypothetical protein